LRRTRVDFSPFFFIIMDMKNAEVEKKIKEITDTIVREYKPEKVMLFGSWAWGYPHEDSDVDLLVIMKSDKSRLDRQQEVRETIGYAGIPVDVLVHTPEELDASINQRRNLFLEDVVRNGQVLYEKPGFEFSCLHKPAELISV